MTSKTTCCICGFLVNVQASGKHKHWYDFIVERKHLFLTLFRMGIFGGAHGWKGGAKRLPLPEVWHTYPTMMELGSYTLPKEDPKNI